MLERMGGMVTIRPASQMDLPTVQALAGVIWRAVYPAILSGAQIEYMLGCMYSLEQLRADAAAGVSFDLLEMDGTPLGFAAYGPAEHGESRICKLHKLYLHPQCHGQGLGSRLLRHVMAVAAKRGYEVLTLNVNKRNAPAIAVYRRHGFAVTQAVVQTIGEGFVMDDYIMEVRLSASAKRAADAGGALP